jgi:hypothetical protein
MISRIENCFAMDCVREDFAMIFIKMDENLNEIRKSCQNDDEMKKYIECFDQISAVKKLIIGKLRRFGEDTGNMSPRGVLNCCIFICGRDLAKARFVITQLTYELERIRSEVKII